MLGKNLYKVESNVDLSNERFKSLVLFYTPLIGAESLALFEYFVINNNSVSFEEISKLLNFLNMSIEKFESLINTLNEYHLVNTLKDEQDDKYVFVVNNPLTTQEFVNDDILVRNFIHSTSGIYYQSLLTGIRIQPKHDNFIDVSKKLDPNILSDWSKEDETFLKQKVVINDFHFNTFFDINAFLKDVSTNLLPLHYRTEENMKELATLADLYNISYDKMRVFVARAIESDSNKFDLRSLRYHCENAQPDFKTVSDGVYHVPCELFLMNKQGGKEVTKYDKKIIYALAHDYDLNPEVINVVIEHGLNNCDNRLIEKYLYSIASDLHRVDIKSADEAKDRLSKYKSKKGQEIIPEYDSTNNPTVDNNELNEILARRSNK